MTHLLSGNFGFFVVASHTIVTRATRENFRAAGIWNDEAEDLLYHGIELPGWSNLSIDEKNTLLSYYHERQHFIDITSLPAGAYYWRIWDCLRDYGEDYAGFLKELNLTSLVTTTVIEFVRSQEGRAIIEERLAPKDRFKRYYVDNEGRNRIISDYCDKYPEIVETLIRVASELCTDNSPSLAKYQEDLNRTSRYLGNLYRTEGVFEPSDYEKVPDAEWIDDGRKRPAYQADYLVSLTDLFEMRAYLYELKILDANNDWSFSDEVLKRMKTALSNNAYAIMKRWVDEKYDCAHLHYMTDVALGGRIDPNCLYFKFDDFDDFSPNDDTSELPRTPVDFETNWPTFRFAAFLTPLIDNWQVLGDHRKANANFYIDLGQRLFGHETYPYTGASLFLRPMIPRDFRIPMELPPTDEFHGGRRYGILDMIVDRPNDEWSALHYRDLVNSNFNANQTANFYSFCNMELPRWALPKVRILGDTVLGINRGPIRSSDAETEERARRKFNGSILKDLIGGALAVHLISGETNKIGLDELLMNWGDSDTKSALDLALREHYGRDLIERFVRWNF